MLGKVGIGVFPLCLLLQAVAGGDFPDFAVDDDWFDDYYVCEGDACAYSMVYLYIDETIQVPNKTVTYEKYKHFDVSLSGLLADCAPSLSIVDIATTIASCRDVDWKYRDACKYRRKEWLGQDGETVKDSLDRDFDQIEGASENIVKCMDWDGVYDYDYYDYYGYDYYDYYDYLEESDANKKRNKRDLNTNVPEFMKQTFRSKRGLYQKEKDDKKKTGKKSKNRNKNRRRKTNTGRKKKNKKKQRKGKNTKRNRNKGRHHKNKNKGNTSKKRNKHKGKPKNRRNKTSKKAKNKKKKNNNKKKQDRKKRKEEREKKKKEKKMLKQLDLDSKPSKEILNKLDCVERAIQFGLEKCGEKIFKDLALP